MPQFAVVTALPASVPCDDEESEAVREVLTVPERFDELADTGGVDPIL
jgi:hypothetical protein